MKKNRKLAVQVSLIVTVAFILALILIGTIVARGTQKLYIESQNEQIEQDMEECKALFMMVSRILIKNHLQAGESPAAALTGVNKQLLENNQKGLFVTVWLAVVELSTGRGVAANAGHEHPTLRRAGGQYELVEYRHASPMGILKRSKFPEHEFELHPGDSLFIYTDGVAEATDRNETLFGTDRMLAALNREPDADCARVLENVMDGIRAFVDGAEQFDDITMLCFRYHGSARQSE